MVARLTRPSRLTRPPDAVALHHGLGRWAFLVVTSAVALAAVTAPAGADRLAAALATASTGCVLAVVAWAPALLVGNDALVVRNPLRTLVIPWSRVDGVRMGWVLEVLADGAVHRAWAAPGPRRLIDTRDLDLTGNVLHRYSAATVDAAARAGHGSLGSADAALVVGQRWAARAAASPDGPVVARTSRIRVALLAVGVLAGVAAGVVAVVGR